MTTNNEGNRLYYEKMEAESRLQDCYERAGDSSEDRAQLMRDLDESEQAYQQAQERWKRYIEEVDRD